MTRLQMRIREVMEITAEQENQRTEQRKVNEEEVINRLTKIWYSQLTNDNIVKWASEIGHGNRHTFVNVLTPQFGVREEHLLNVYEAVWAKDEIQERVNELKVEGVFLDLQCRVGSDNSAGASIKLTVKST